MQIFEVLKITVVLTFVSYIILTNTRAYNHAPFNGLNGIGNSNSKLIKTNTIYMVLLKISIFLIPFFMARGIDTYMMADEVLNERSLKRKYNKQLADSPFKMILKTDSKILKKYMGINPLVTSSFRKMAFLAIFTCFLTTIVVIYIILNLNLNQNYEGRK